LKGIIFMENNLKVLIYADVDMNLIDGSSIWVTSLISVLTRSNDIKITLLLKRPIIRSILVDPFLDNKQVLLFDPWQEFKSELSNEKWFETKKLNSEDAVTIIKRLNKNVKFDVVFIRGLDILMEIGKNEELSAKTWAYITDIPLQTVDYVDKFKHFKTTLNNLKLIFSQTEEIKIKFSKGLDIDKSKFMILPPIIPDYPAKKPEFKCSRKCLVYTGKFDPLWYTKEAIYAFRKIHERYPDAEFHIAGDKFNSTENTIVSLATINVPKNLEQVARILSV
jgi:hypothetical protein